MEEFELAGYWFLPGTPDEKVAGTLHVSSTGAAELHLIGALRPFMANAMKEANDGPNGEKTAQIGPSHFESEYPRILGNANGQAITLDRCIRTNHRVINFGAAETETIKVQQIFRHVWLDENEAQDFNRLAFGLDWLVFWVEPPPLTTDLNRPNGEFQGAVITMTGMPEVACAGPAGSRIALQELYHVSGNQTSAMRLEQDFRFSIDYDHVVPLSNLSTLSKDIQDLVSIATGQRAAYRRVFVTHPDVTREVPDKPAQAIELDYIAKWTVTNDKPTGDLPTQKMWFTFAELGGMPGLERWLRVASNYRQALSRAITTRYADQMFVVDRAFNCAAALEGYDRERHGDDVNYAARIDRCMRIAGDPFKALVGDQDGWMKALKKVRNDVAHQNMRVDEEPLSDLMLAESAFMLLVLCILKECDSPQPAIDHMMNNAHAAWVRKMVVESGMG